MLARDIPVDDPTYSEDTARIQVRSITGATYTLIETTRFEAVKRGARVDARVVGRSYRTAYASLPVARNEDGSFTIVDTRTRLARIEG